MKKLTVNRPVYRKWYDPDEDSQNFLKINRSGIMLQITFECEDPDYTKVSIGQTTPLNRLDPDVFRKHKEICSKSEFETAQRKAITMIKGGLMDLSHYKKIKASDK